MAEMFADVPEELSEDDKKSHESLNYNVGYVGDNVLK